MSIRTRIERLERASPTARPRSIYAAMSDKELVERVRAVSVRVLEAYRDGNRDPRVVGVLRRVAPRIAEELTESERAEFVTTPQGPRASMEGAEGESVPSWTPRQWAPPHGREGGGHG